MILGIGIDLVEIDRFKFVMKKNTFSKLIKRGAHSIEIKNAPQLGTIKSVEYWASRFAVKEAFSKALGTGFGSSFQPKDIGVDNEKTGKPFIVFDQNYKNKLNSKGIERVHLSITHTKNYAQAVVIFEGKGKK